MPKGALMEAQSNLRNFIIGEKSWNTMQQFARLAYDEDKNEISGLLHVKKTKHPVSGEPVYELFDPIILEQENTGTTTELDGDAIRDYTVKAGMKYGTDIKFCWWHSHHTMGAFWSGTDDKEIQAWHNDSWSIALVVNLYQEYKLNISVWNPIEFSEDIPLEIIRPIPEPTSKQKKEYEKLCSTANPIANHNYGVYKPGHGWIKGGTNTLNKNQTTFLSNKESPLALTDKFKWANSDVITPYAELIEELDNELEEIIETTMSGEICYKDYSSKLDAINRCLKTRNAKVKIVKIKEGKLLEKAACMQTWEHFKYDDEDVEKIYDDARLTSYSHNYMGGAWS
jgi:hypothetical protein